MNDSEETERNLTDPVGLSRQEKIESFTKFMEDLGTKPTYHGVEQWIDPERFLQVIKNQKGIVSRNYWRGETWGTSIGMAASIDFEPPGNLIVTCGSIFSAEGESHLSFYPDRRSIQTAVRVTNQDMGLEFKFDDSGRIYFVSFGRLFQRADGDYSEIIGLYFDNEDRERMKTSKTGMFQIINDENEPFVRCVKKSDDDVVTYKIPKVVDPQIGISQIIPEELMEDPYNAPPKFDKWRTADFLKAFGVETEYSEDNPPEI